METTHAKELKISHVIEMRPKPPFHFDGTFHKPSHFPYVKGIENTIWEPGKYYMTMRVNDRIFGLKLESIGTIDEPTVNLTIFSDSPASSHDVQDICDELAYRFDFNTDLRQFNLILKKDELMHPVLSRWRGMRIYGGNLYENFIIYIVLQNATVRRSVQMLGSLLQTYGIPIQFDGVKLYAFWVPEAMDLVSEDELRELKVGYRAKTIKKISSQFTILDEKKLRTLPNKDLKQELLKIYGVGPATVWYVMFEIFHKMDAFEHISPWEQKIYSKLLFGEECVPATQILDEVHRRWGEWKMLAAHYLFEDLFWRRKNEPVEWLEKLIRL